LVSLVVTFAGFRSLALANTGIAGLLVGGGSIHTSFERSKALLRVRSSCFYLLANRAGVMHIASRCSQRLRFVCAFDKVIKLFKLGISTLLGIATAFFNVGEYDTQKKLLYLF